ncbi:MAG: N-acetylmuramoyl-L-alanine amidase [Myxococcales bacterium]|nr:N-acetylmuramoyl-L-alanine amidase [Myxococcales bacterium]MCB9754592.1 N-acetylmuramoyl-L-alanine amidase [Myxococcales bacterium]
MKTLLHLLLGAASLSAALAVNPALAHAAPDSTALAVDDEYLGDVDHHTSARAREVTTVVVHNGGSASVNNSTWQDRRASCHYTINRDGAIYQHVEEGRVAWHAKSANATSIGVELEIRRKYGRTCNNVRKDGKAAELAREQGVRVEDVYAELCAPTPAQYKALSALIRDIKTRHPVDRVVGHCEVEPEGGHADPRAFDWTRLGEAPRAPGSDNACDWYRVAAVHAKVVGFRGATGGGQRITLNRGSEHGLSVGDLGYMHAGDADAPTADFVIERVRAREADAIVNMTLEQVKANRQVSVSATFGGARGEVTGARGGLLSAREAGDEKPRLGSCEDDFTYHKGGTIKDFTVGEDGAIETLTLANAGWSQRVCDDARGMIYAGDKTDAFVEDEGGQKIRFQTHEVSAGESVARITHGRLTPELLRGNTRIVVRSKR